MDNVLFHWIRPAWRFFLASLLLGGLPAAFAQAGEEAAHAHEGALKVVTEDPELKSQIVKVHEALTQLHEAMAKTRQAIQQETDEKNKVGLYAQMDELQKEHDDLEGLLHELILEATATDWTEIDEALSRVRAIELRREHDERQEEVLRDRQQ